MRNDAVAKAYFHQAESRLRAAEHALTERNFPFAVRLSQECVELSKAALRLYGVEYPKEHDVGGLLIEVKDRFPAWFSGLAEEFREISARLAAQRGPSMYGDEEEGLAPSQLFDEKSAKEAIQGALKVHSGCKRLLEEFLRQKH